MRYHLLLLLALAGCTRPTEPPDALAELTVFWAARARRHRDAADRAQAKRKELLPLIGSEPLMRYLDIRTRKHLEAAHELESMAAARAGDLGPIHSREARLQEEADRAECWAWEGVVEQLEQVRRDDGRIRAEAAEREVQAKAPRRSRW